MFAAILVPDPRSEVNGSGCLLWVHGQANSLAIKAAFGRITRDAMAPSLSLTTYLTFARREAPTWDSGNLVRPNGTLLWLHCSDPSRVSVIVQLGARLATQRGDTRILVTLSPRHAPPKGLPDEILFCPAPSENPSDVEKFLAFWKPDALIWSGPWLRPALIQGAHQSKVPMVLVDADEISIEHKNWRWLPDSVRATLQMFACIYAVNAASAYRLRRMLGMDGPIEDSGPLLEENPALSCSETDLEDLGEVLRGRPVWLAARVQIGELDPVLAAHRASMRLSPRMLLIIVPDRPQDAGAVLSACEDGGWRLNLWDNGEMPDEKTQILLAEDARELGLFYRIAPMSFLGSSLVSGQGGRNPYEPAALGSAILYGPGVRHHLNAYSKLAKAGAARIVKDADSLSAAVASLMAPDKVAKMVHAGWEIVSEGALVADRIIDRVNTAMDQREMR